jgi:hypothetical protein
MSAMFRPPSSSDEISDPAAPSRLHGRVAANCPNSLCCMRAANSSVTSAHNRSVLTTMVRAGPRNTARVTVAAVGAFDDGAALRCETSDALVFAAKLAVGRVTGRADFIMTGGAARRFRRGWAAAVRCSGCLFALFLMFPLAILLFFSPFSLGCRLFFLGCLLRGCFFFSLCFAAAGDATSEDHERYGEQKRALQWP